MNEQQTIRELATETFEETVRWYSEDTARRGLHSGSPKVNMLYDETSGNCCAIGRCLDRERAAVHRSWPIYITIDEILGYGLLRAPYNRITGYDFWQRLLRFHDHFEHWDDLGLSPEGLRYVHETRQWLRDCPDRELEGSV